MSLFLSSDRADLRKELESYSSEYEVEKAFKERMLFLLDNHANCFERSLEFAHFTASAWVINDSSDECLLTHHAKLNRWLQIGGHADGEEDLKRVCLKEVHEESSLSKISLVNGEIFDLDIHLIPERKGIPAHDHYDVRFLVLADRNEEIKFNHESMEMKWVLLKDVDQMSAGNDSMKRMVNKTFELRIK